MARNDYNPDVLNCLANLSSDEIFTPPQLANRMLDLLPQELFSNPATRFLDPCCKSGVFLREIVKRLDRGLQSVIADRRERIEHIVQRQVFGIAITELTALMSRRSVYCSKYADSPYSVHQFGTREGNIQYQPLHHTWQGGKCVYCGASQGVYDRGEAAEQHAYQFIHTNNPEKIFNMKFDVIIGNPPYQLDDGGAQASAIPIYNKFVTQAKMLKPRYLCMIIPSRWFAGGRGLDSFRKAMLEDRKIRVIVDHFDSNDCFPGIDLSGGVCYFLWDRDNQGDCSITSVINGISSTMVRPLLDGTSNTFVRMNQAIEIIRKIQMYQEVSFSTIVSTQKPFGLRTYIQGTERKNEKDVLLYSNKNADMGGTGYIPREKIEVHREWIDKYKVYISSAYGERGSFPYLVTGKPFLGNPNSCCTETYLVIGPFGSKNEAESVISYIKTRLFRFLVLLLKNTQHAPTKVYQFVPMQDFSHPWTDEMLYEKYGLTEEEIAFIESMVRPMD